MAHVCIALDGTGRDGRGRGGTGSISIEPRPSTPMAIRSRFGCKHSGRFAARCAACAALRDEDASAAQEHGGTVHQESIPEQPVCIYRGPGGLDARDLVQSTPGVSRPSNGSPRLSPGPCSVPRWAKEKSYDRGNKGPLGPTPPPRNAHNPRRAASARRPLRLRLEKEDNPRSPTGSPRLSSSGRPHEITPELDADWTLPR